MDKIIKELPNVTLIAIAGSQHGETLAAIYKCLEQIKPAKALMLTNIDTSANGIEVINVGGLKSWEAYNRFCIKELNKYFNTSHCLLVQWDGYILNGELWDDKFLEYDYIGAKWLDIGKPYNVGNGGFSLRSQKLQDILSTDENIITTCPEDTSIAKVYGQYLMDKYGIKFAPEDVADKFSFELNQPLNKTFGFHGFHRQPFKETIVFKRHHALGDVIMMEPVMEHFYKQGYNIAIDTLPELNRVYFQHYFPVTPKEYLHPKLPYREINLDMAYEIKPKQSVLQSYFEMAEVDIPVLRNSRLFIRAGDRQKLFNKYAVIHINETDMPYRNIYGLEWSAVVKYLENNGYLVFQIGKGVTTPVATYLNTMNLEFTMFFISGADLFIGSDSGPAQIAVGFNIPSVIFFGSVNPELRYHNFFNIQVVQTACPKKETEHCYHNSIDVVGSHCVYNKELPPCTQYTSTQVINAVKELIWR